MRNKVKIIIILMALLGAEIGSAEELPIREIIYKETDTLSFDEVVSLLEEKILYVELFGAFLVNNDMDVQDKSDEDGIYEEEEFTLKKPYSIEDFKKNIKLCQKFSYPMSAIYMENFECGRCEINYTLEKINFKDGTSRDTPADAKYPYFEVDGTKAANSAIVRIKYTYPVSLLKLALSDKNRKAELNGHKIELTGLNFNNAKLIMNKHSAERFLSVQAKTPSGKRVGTFASESGPVPKRETISHFNNLTDSLNKLLDKARNNNYTTKESLVEAIIEVAEKFDLTGSTDKLNNDSEKYWQGLFYGNIEELYLYIGEEYKTDEYLLELSVVSDINKYNVFENNELYGIIDENGTIIIPAEHKDYIDQINSFYYMRSSANDDSHTVLHLNLTTAKLDNLPGYAYGYTLTSELTRFIKDDMYGALNNSGQVVIPFVWDELHNMVSKNETPFLLARNKDGYYMLSYEGKQIFGPFDYYRNYSDSWLKFSKNNKESFINENGDVADFTMYDKVGNYVDGMVMVRKDGKYGFTDIGGNIAVPPMYDDASDFFKGITNVKLNGKSGLIDKENNIVVPIIHSSPTYINTNEKERTYGLGDKVFDTKGAPVEEK